MVARTATGSPTIAASTSTPPMTIAVAIAATGSSKHGERIPAGVDPEVEDPASQLTDAAPTIGKGRRDECRARQCKGVEEDERSNTGQIEVDDPDAGQGQQRQGEDRRAGPVGDGEEDGKWVSSGDGTHLWFPLGYSGRRTRDRRASHSVASGPADVVRLSGSNGTPLEGMDLSRSGDTRVVPLPHPMDGCWGSAAGGIVPA